MVGSRLKGIFDNTLAQILGVAILALFGLGWALIFHQGQSASADHAPKATPARRPTRQQQPTTVPKLTTAPTNRIVQTIAPPAPPTILEYTRLATMFAGETSANFCATVLVPATDVGTVYFAADYGSFSPPSFLVDDQTKVCTTYAAPDASNVSNDRITVRLVDRHTSLSDVATETVPVKSGPMPPS